MWSGNTADVKTLIPVADRLRKRFRIHRFCIVADRGMISADTMKQLEDPERNLPYILGIRRFGQVAGVISYVSIPNRPVRMRLTGKPF